MEFRNSVISISVLLGAQTSPGQTQSYTYQVLDIILKEVKQLGQKATTPVG
jgi:hypothetical protein